MKAAITLQQNSIKANPITSSSKSRKILTAAKSLIPCQSLYLMHLLLSLCFVVVTAIIVCLRSSHDVLTMTFPVHCTSLTAFSCFSNVTEFVIDKQL